MKVIVKKIYDNKNKETGANLTAFFGQATTNKQKFEIERKLIDYAFNKLYPGHGMNLYSDFCTDSASITVLINCNDLPYEEIEI